jgi:hypothetical protein
MSQITLIEELDEWQYSLERKLESGSATFRDFKTFYKVRRVKFKIKNLYRFLNRPYPSMCISRARDKGIY